MEALVHFMDAGCHAAMSIHSLPLPFIQSGVTMGPTTATMLMSFYYVSRLMMGARALAKTGLIVVMCLPTEQSPDHVGERERKERAFPLRFFAFPDGCFARERAWIGATYSWRKAHACAPCPLLIHFAYKVAARGAVHGQRIERSQAGMVVYIGWRPTS